MKSLKNQIQILYNLFENPTKVLLFRLFLRNPVKSFTVAQAQKMIQCDSRMTKKQIDKLVEIKFLRKKIIKVKDKKKIRKFEVFEVNHEFDFYNELKSLILKSSLVSFHKMAQKIKGMGRVKLLLISGLFLNLDNARADMLLVADGLKKNKFNNFLKNIESEAGRELDYVIMPSKEFEYRYGMFDNFIRDVLENKNLKLIDKYHLD